MKCALCDEKNCYKGKDCTSIKDEISYEGGDLDSMQASAEIEARYYMEKTRIEELILYAQKMGYKKLGIAFCIGLQREAKTIHRILARDFEVFSVCCKVCGIDKEDFNLEKLYGKGFEATCNPIGQAKVLNESETDLNIIVGLCIGHDILFTQNSKAPVTTLVVKDRVLAHNPVGAIYSGYYLKKRFGITE
jgi:uncharacterized metal-binding protein